MDAPKETFYRNCVVPKCKNNVKSTPDKTFFHVPKDPNKRKQWCKAMRSDQISPTTIFHCCEDHFNVEEDTENFIQYKIMKEQGVKVSLRLKKGIVPHLFKCQNRTRSPPAPRVYSIKRQRLALINEAISEFDAKSCSVSESGPSTAVIECDDFNNKAGPSAAIIEPHDSEGGTSTAITESHECEGGSSTALIDFHDCEAGPSTAFFEYQGSILIESHDNKAGPSTAPIGCQDEVKLLQSNKSVQVNMKSKKYYRSKGINAKLKTDTKNVALTPLTLPSKNIATSPIKSTQASVVVNLVSENQVNESQSSKSSVLSPDYEPSSSSELTCVEGDSGDEKYFKNTMRTVMLTAIEKEPKQFLGLNKKSYHLIKLLSENVPLHTTDILITLKKIKLNDSFDILAIHFGYAKSTVSRIFSKSVPVIASKLKDLVVNPTPKQILKNLPIAFRARYSKVASIIDALEIQIEQPSDVVHQSMTWSQYKKCNTLKYLISCTPDGLITFISEGYGGRTTDMLIVEDCKFLDTLHPNTAVMADRGFKELSRMLVVQNCSLIRPPSVSKSAPSTKDEVRQSKRIAALRIHVERVISRLRDFHMLKPHATVDHNLTPVIDEVVVIACALINMQDVLIKQ